MASKTQKKKPSAVTRSAITGHFVKKSTVKRHPKTSVTQKVSRRTNKKGS